MIFALATDERTLMVFSTPDEAIAHCEGIDVEDGLWLFWAESGAALQPLFLTPNYRDSIVVGSGTYRLVLAQPLPGLAQTLGEISAMEANPFFSSLQAVQAHLARVAQVPQYDA
ncbi:hypothetical protein GGR77_003683 [Xanthomonas translucens]